MTCASALAVFAAIPQALAQSRPGNPFRLETTDEARQRHGAERYQQYEQNNRSAPLGGYRERLGDPAPYGTPSPGYRSNDSYGSPSGGGLGGVPTYQRRY